MTQCTHLQHSHYLEKICRALWSSIIIIIIVVVVVIIIVLGWQA